MVEKQIKAIKVVHSEKLYDETFYANPLEYRVDKEQIFIQYFLDSLWRGPYSSNPNFTIHRVQLFLITEGECICIKSDGSKACLTAGTFVMDSIMDIPDAFCKYKVPLKSVYKRKGICILKNSLLEVLLSRFFQSRFEVIHLQEPVRVEKILDEIRAVIAADCSETAKLTGLVIELFCECGLQRKNRQYPVALRQAIEYIQGNFRTASLARSDIASTAGISVRTLNRLFLQHLKSSPTVFLLNCRMHTVRSLLECSFLTVKEIAQECGFSSASFLTKCFHAKYGYSPLAYRKSKQFSKQSEQKLSK